MPPLPEDGEGSDFSDEGTSDFEAFRYSNKSPDERAIAEENRSMWRRQEHLRVAAEYVAPAFGRIPVVRKVVLFGSVAVPLEKEVPRFREFRRAVIAVWHECKDVDTIGGVHERASLTLARFPSKGVWSMAGGWYRYSGFFPRSTPRKTKGGIKAQSKRGSFGESWWARRWIAVLESFHIGARLGRGRSYARRGQVLSIDIDKGRVKAGVQGSRSRPYDVVIKVKTLSAAKWKKLAKTLSGQALFAAKLLSGEMPQDIEKAFGDAGLSLFPEKLRDLTTDCSCPDWSNPCKHIAAVYYLLGEEFDRDPFLLFKLRGMSRKELVGLLDATGSEAGKQRSRAKAARCEADVGAPEPSQPLPCDVSAYWDRGQLPDDLFGEVRVPAMPATLPKRLGSFPFWRAEERFLEAIEAAYRDASVVGMDVFLGQRDAG